MLVLVNFTQYNLYLKFIFLNKLKLKENKSWIFKLTGAAAANTTAVATASAANINMNFKKSKSDVSPAH